MKLKVPGVAERLARGRRLRAGARASDLEKPPGVAETIDWAQALTVLGRERIDEEVVETTLVPAQGARGRRGPARGRRHARRGRARGREPVTDPGMRSSATSSPSAVCSEPAAPRSGRAAADAVRGLDAVGLRDERDVYFTLRQTLVSHRDELELFDLAFASWVRGVETGGLVEQGLTVLAPASARRSGREDGNDGPTARERRARAAPRSSRSCAGRTSRSSTRRSWRRSRACSRKSAASVLAGCRGASDRPRAGNGSTSAGSYASLRSGGELVELPTRTRKVVPASSSFSATSPGRWRRTHGRCSSSCTRPRRPGGGGVRVRRVCTVTSDLAARNPDAALARVAERRRLGQRDEDRLVAEAVQRRVRSPGAVARGRRRHRVRRLGARGARASRPRDGASLARRVLRRVDQPAQGNTLRAARRECVRRSFVDRFLPGHNLDSLEGSPASSPASKEARRVKEILPDVERWEEGGESVVVARSATRRSTPCPVGSSFAISSSGALCGSVSGGCVESDVYERAQEVFETGVPALVTYGISDDQAWSVGPVRRRDRRLPRAARRGRRWRRPRRACGAVHGPGRRERGTEAARPGGRDADRRRATGARRARAGDPPPREEPACGARRHACLRRVVRAAAAVARVRGGRHGRSCARRDSAGARSSPTRGRSSRPRNASPRPIA